ncbi:hypothetical protein JHE06_00565 [Carnobacterium sp. CS13]|uniref:hypothetical protein n=1 Tax=Carnobacterium sp. CS13 TaxID=2800128 RepID=UPI0019139BF5|nr:hypothetical protein [Carnobacterium sp. CS13]QQP70385.1 hypothetical protein JHE06_00565 [Carnobacterium sp. CS13]
MKKKNVLLLTILTGIVITIILIFGPFKKDIWEINASKLEDSTDNISAPTAIDDFSKWTPFEWDTLYSFAPYTKKENIYKVVGYKWDNINESVNDNMNQIVFVKDGKVVCYLYGYPKNTNSSYNFGEYEGEYITFNSQQKLAFDVEIGADEIRYFNYINN